MPYYADSEDDDESAHIFTEDGSKGIVVLSGAGYRLDFENGEVTTLDGTFPEVSKGALQDDGGMFAFWNSEDRILRVYTGDGKPAWTISDLTDEFVGNIWFYEGDLFVSTENNGLYRYRARDGKPYAPLKTNLTIWNNSKGIFDDGGSLIIESGSVMRKSASCDVLMVDLENWAVSGEAHDVLGYCEGTRQIVSVADEGSENAALGACPYYSAGDLIEKGRRFVGEHELTEEEKARYGLD